MDALNLVIDDNAFVTLLGPSGCGKTTTLRMIAGLETPTSGRITIDGVPVFDSELGINISANNRRVGFLFQNYALWPNMTVYQNISFGLSNIKQSMPEVDWTARKAARLAEILSKPDELTALLRDAFGQDEKRNEEKALLRLIDTYEISRFHRQGDSKPAPARRKRRRSGRQRGRRRLAGGGCPPPRAGKSGWHGAERKL